MLNILKGWKRKRFLKIEIRKRGGIRLSYVDSNHDRQNQKLQCYHYTIRQSLAAKACALNRVAKLLTKSGPTKFFRVFNGGAKSTGTQLKILPSKLSCPGVGMCLNAINLDVIGDRNALA